MLIEESHVDVPTKHGGDMSTQIKLQKNTKPSRLTLETGIFIFHPKIDGYPKAKFPGVVVFSEIYQGGLIFLLTTLHATPITPIGDSQHRMGRTAITRFSPEGLRNIGPINR